MRTFIVTFTVKGIELVEWVNAATNTRAIASLLSKLSNRDKAFFKLLNVKVRS